MLSLVAIVRARARSTEAWEIDILTIPIQPFARSQVHTCIMSPKHLAILCWLCHFVASNAADGGVGMQQITPTPVLQARGAFQTAGFISGDPGTSTYYLHPPAENTKV